MSTTGTSGNRPVATFALRPSVKADVYPSDVIDRIERITRLDRDSVLTDFTSAESLEVLAKTEILLTGWGCPPIDESVLQAAPLLQAVFHAAGTVKQHVAEVVYERGVTVSSAADANARPVAEYTVAMIVLTAKRLLVHADRYATGAYRWAHRQGEASGLAGTTIGLVGASRIGRLVTRMLADYDVRVLLTDPYATDEEILALGAEPADLDKLCATADIVSLHAPALPETRHLMDESRLSLLRDGAVLINTARGSLVDTEALTRHCATGRIDAVLDVTDPEPLPTGHPLLTLENVLVTPHLAGVRGRELRLLGNFAADEVERFVAGVPLQGQVRLADLARIA